MNVHDPKWWDAEVTRHAESVRMQVTMSEEVVAALHASITGPSSAKNRERMVFDLLRDKFAGLWINQWLLPGRPDPDDVPVLARHDPATGGREFTLRWAPPVTEDHVIFVDGPCADGHVHVLTPEANAARRDLLRRAVPLPEALRFVGDETPIPGHPDLTRMTLTLGPTSVEYAWDGWHPKHRAWVRRMA